MNRVAPRTAQSNGQSSRTLSRPMGHPIEEFFNSFWGQPSSLMKSMQMDQGNLALDIAESEDEVAVTATLPGFSKDEVSVELEDGVLTIRAEHSESKEESSEEGEGESKVQYLRRERRMGSYARRVSLPTAVSDADAKAELKDGILTLRFPKVKEAKARKIEIE